MKTFSTLRSYLDALEAGHTSAILPLQLVADHLDVTRAAVDRMLRPDIEQLRAIKIDGTRFVDAKSLRELEAARNEDLRRVRQYLETRARSGEPSVFYEPVMHLINRKPKVPADRAYIGGILGKISEATDRENGLLLSVLVHRKSTGRTRPGLGFFGLARKLKRRWRDDDEFVRVETEKALKHYKSLRR